MKDTGAPAFSLRSAEREDSGEVRDLIVMAIEGIANILAGSDDDGEVCGAMEEFFLMERSRLSYRNVIVAIVGGGLAGMIISYRGDEIDALDMPILDRLRRRGIERERFEQECFPDEYYLDSLAVFPRYRGMGLARALMEAAEEKCREYGMGRTALIVEGEKKDNIAIYGRLGYVKDCTLTVGGHTYLHMVKTSPPGENPDTVSR